MPIGALADSCHDARSLFIAGRAVAVPTKLCDRLFVWLQCTHVVGYKQYMSSITKRNRADRHRIGLDTEKLRSAREKAGLTQEQAAQKSGIGRTRQKWSDLENGERTNITLNTLDRIAAALGVKAKDLLK
jgi:DNA-binding XRE family transcriptional regulator